MSVQVSRILHAGYLFQSKQANLAFDPIFENPFSRNCFAYPDAKFDLAAIRILKLDAVFISHFHDDHCSLESLNLLLKETPIFLYCQFPEIPEMIRKLGFQKVHELQIGESIEIKDFKITIRPALDFDVDSLFHVQIQNLNILNVVDSWIDPDELQRLARTKWDLILWPFQTMRELEALSPSRSSKEEPEIPSEWKEQLQILKPKFLVPSSCQFIHESWSWYNQFMFPITYKRFAAEMQEILPKTKIQRMDPGSSFHLTDQSLTASVPVSWIQTGSATDYDFRPDLQVPTSAEVAKHFPALSQSQKEKVFDYCQKDLLNQYPELGTADDYFLKPRLWKLSLFDHQGEKIDFLYEILDQKIELVTESSLDFGWLTEISIYKLHSALTTGESLTSLYARINDRKFTNEIEKDLNGVDLVEDPLVRCLFNKSPAAYQEAQLRRILEQN